MVKLEKASLYFREPGPGNTEDVLRAVIRRVEEGDIEAVVVASTSGRTGLRFAEALKGKVKLIAVSYEKMEPELKGRITELGGIAADETHLPLHERGMDDVRN
ncbi:MAG: pyruvate kinase alpha/beta domain-containing protein, partial [Candidatus Bathyarchaeia archaeon]